MPRHRQLRARGENAESKIGPALLGRQDEGRLGKIHLLGDRLHGIGRETAAVEKHGELVAAEELSCKDVVVKVPV